MNKIVKIMSSLFEALDIPYTFEDWDKEHPLPQFIGECFETPTNDEDRCQEYTFLLTGFADNYDELWYYISMLEKRFKSSDVEQGVIITYRDTISLDTDIPDMRRTQTTLTIKDWSV